MNGKRKSEETKRKKKLWEQQKIFSVCSCIINARCDSVQNRRTWGSKHRLAIEKCCFCRFEKKRKCNLSWLRNKYMQKNSWWAMYRKWNGQVFRLWTHSPTNYSSSSLFPSASHRKNRWGKKSQKSAQTGGLEECQEEEENFRTNPLREAFTYIKVADNACVLMCWKKTKTKTKQSEFYGKRKTRSFSCITTDSH